MNPVATVFLCLAIVGVLIGFAYAVHRVDQVNQAQIEQLEADRR